MPPSDGAIPDDDSVAGPLINEVNVTVDVSTERTLLQGVRLVACQARPHWNPKTVDVKTLTGGTTNTLLRCDDSSTGERVLVRIYGPKTELFIDRGAEVRNMRLLHKHGLAPQVYCAFRNGLCYGYFPGEVLDTDRMVHPEVTLKIASHMARMHAIPMGGRPEAKIVPMLEQYLSLVPEEILKNAERTLEEEFGEGKINLAAEVQRLKLAYALLKQNVVFCHNDLLSKNIILNGDQINFIDYEYASANFQGFDIGNFFCEFGGQEKYDRRRYPSKDWQLDWIRGYLKEYRQFKGMDPPTEADTEELFVLVNKCALASLLLWGLWALIQRAHSSIAFDFEGLATDRLGMYFACRDQFLAL